VAALRAWRTFAAARAAAGALLVGHLDKSDTITHTATVPHSTESISKNMSVRSFIGSALVTFTKNR
jgi:hypothetical protein